MYYMVDCSSCAHGAKKEYCCILKNDTGSRFVVIVVHYAYGLLVALLFHYRNRKKNAYRSILLFTVLFLSGFLFQDAIQCFAALAVPIIVVCEKTGTERVQSPVAKTVYRWFYPVHLSVLAVFKYIFA